MTSWFIHDINSALCHGSMNIAQQSSFSHFRLARLKRMCRCSSCNQQRCRIWSSYFDENWEILTINSFKKHSHHLWCPCTFRRRFLPLHALPAQHFSSANFIQLYNLEVYIFFIWSWDRVFQEFGDTNPELMYTVGLKVGIGDGIGGDRGWGGLTLPIKVLASISMSTFSLLLNIYWLIFSLSASYNCLTV